MLSTITLVKVEYWHKDHLGSLIATTDHTGAVTEHYAYDPFGKRRYVNGTEDAAGNLVLDWSYTKNWGAGRGFTGHEQLDDIGLVHMNGRIFDPTLGVFLQADPMIQDGFNLQNYNRYGYCYNNPLTCTDPSGRSFWTSFRGAFIRALAVAADYYTDCIGCFTTAVGAYQGYQAGGVKGAIVGGVIAYVGANYGQNFSPAEAVFFAAASGCANAAAAGGSCKQGAVSGLIQNEIGGNEFFGQVFAGCVGAAATGGRCSQGAVNAAGDWAGGAAGNWVAMQGVPTAIAYLQDEAKIGRLPGSVPMPAKFSINDIIINLNQAIVSNSFSDGSNFLISGGVYDAGTGQADKFIAEVNASWTGSVKLADGSTAT